MTDALQFRRRAILLPALLLAAALLAACTAVPLPGTVDLRTIRLAPIAEPLRYDLNVFAAPGMGLRLGTHEAVLARDIARPPTPGDKDAAFTAALRDRAGLHLGAELAEALGQAITAAGIRLAADGAPADATLFIELLYAGYAEQPFRPYTPLLLIEARLVADGADGDTGPLLFRQRYNYGRHTYLHDDVRLAPDPRFSHAAEAALLAAPEAAAEGLRAALPLIARDVARRLDGRVE
jgi:hypothetical protein